MIKDILTDPKLGLPASFNFSSSTTLSDLISALFNVAFMIAGFLAFFWFVWGAFQYIFAGGEKEALSNAKKRMTWAIVGFLFVSIAFLIAQFIQQTLQPKGGTPVL